MVAGFLVGLSCACVLFIGVQPSSYRIARSRTLRASPERVHAQLADVRTLADWDPWRTAHSPPSTRTFSPSSRGVGAWVQGASSEGTTRITIVTDTPRTIELRNDLDDRVDASRQRFELAPSGLGTVLTWSVFAENSLLGRALWPFVGLEARLAPDMESALARLDARLAEEGRALAVANQSIPASPTTAPNLAALRRLLAPHASVAFDARAQEHGCPADQTLGAYLAMLAENGEGAGEPGDVHTFTGGCADAPTSDEQMPLNPPVDPAYWFCRIDAYTRDAAGESPWHYELRLRVRKVDALPDLTTLACPGA
jgi:hypothetical protein